MRIFFCAIPALGTGTALLLLRGYPLTREKVSEIQAALNVNRARPIST
jgi:Na+/melibiose symporter-like transporter